MPKLWTHGRVRRIEPRVDTLLKTHRQFNQLIEDLTGSPKTTMPILRPVRERRAQPRTTVCPCSSCARLREGAPALRALPDDPVKVSSEAQVDPVGFMNGYGPDNIPMAIVKLPRFGLIARAKRSYGDWRRQQLERRVAKRAAELQMLKELEHSSESVLRPFRRLVMLVFGGSLLDRD